MRSILHIGIVAAFAIVLLPAQNTAADVGSPGIFIAPEADLGSYISAAIVKKHVPAIITSNREDAAFVLTSSVKVQKENAGSKVVRCAFAFCSGMQGNQTAAVQLIDTATQEVVWAYSVQKGSAGAYKSSAEAIAKHLREFLNKRSPDSRIVP